VSVRVVLGATLAMIPKIETIRIPATTTGHNFIAFVRGPPLPNRVPILSADGVSSTFATEIWIGEPVAVAFLYAK
jgi:hypothetical protein